MHALRRMCLFAVFALTLAGCAGPRLGFHELPRSGGLSAVLGSDGRPARDCTADTVVVLCVGDGCRFYRCRDLAPALASAKRLRNPDGTWLPLPGALGMHPERTRGRIASDTFFTSGTGGGSAIEAAATQVLPELRLENAGDRDVIQRILTLQKPGDVAQWWRSGPRTEPERWTHPLSEWERTYLEKMSDSSVPEPVRMWAPVNPERLTPEQLEEAGELFGGGRAAAQSFANWENRRRIVGHYVWTHPATIRLVLTAYGFARDTNPLFFALERGWQVGRGKEMFTEQDASRLGAAAEFFAGLAVGIVTNKALLSVRPSPPGLRPPSEPVPAPRRESPAPPGASGKVIPLDRARAARSAQPGTQPSPAMEEVPLASTGTDGPPGQRGGSSRGPAGAPEENPHGSSGKSSAPPEETDAAGLGGIGATGECSGQLHHVISRPIFKELKKNPNLRSHYTERDPRFVARAADKAAHNGYQRWHRDLDTEVIEWLESYREATPHQFEAKLREIYNRPDMRARFPHGF